MESLSHDTVRINQHLFRIAQSPSGANFLARLEANRAVIDKIVGASEQSKLTAQNCGVPLATFTMGIEDLLLRPTIDVPLLDEDETSVQGEARAFSRFLLECAWGLAHRNVTVTVMLFGLSRLAVDQLAKLGLSDVYDLHNRRPPRVRLRGANQPLFWEHLLIGDRCRGSRGHRFAQQAAMMSIASENA